MQPENAQIHESATAAGTLFGRAEDEYQQEPSCGSILKASWLCAQRASLTVNVVISSYFGVLGYYKNRESQKILAFTIFTRTENERIRQVLELGTIYMEDMQGLWYAMVPIERAPDGTISANVRIPENSSWFDGHFPDAPVLPAIAQLDMVIAMIARAAGADLMLKSATRVKFKRLIGPGAALVVTARPEAASGEPHHYRYRISEDEDEASNGNLVLIPKTAETAQEKEQQYECGNSSQKHDPPRGGDHHQ